MRSRALSGDLTLSACFLGTLWTFQLHRCPETVLPQVSYQLSGLFQRGLGSRTGAWRGPQTFSTSSAHCTGIRSYPVVLWLSPGHQDVARQDLMPAGVHAGSDEFTKLTAPEAQNILAMINKRFAQLREKKVRAKRGP